jgi:ribosomal protein S18 acetylase RimI-like enzyme
MIAISEATLADVKTIQNIVDVTWPITYGAILAKEQLEYMIDLIYCDTALAEQIQKKEQLFYLVSIENRDVAFFAIEHNYRNTAVTRIHKIYLLPETQGKGLGRFMVEEIQKLATKNYSKALSLNVNRFNEALFFYQKIGFEIIAEEDVSIGNGYLMEDYKMEKMISKREDF